MRSLATIALVFGLGVVVGVRARTASPEALAAGDQGSGGGSEPDCAIQSGDINADGEVDLSDAVSLLLGLFAGGPRPAPACPPADLTQRVEELESQVDDLKDELIACQASLMQSGMPATGMTQCYDYEGIWRETPCDQAACKGQDAQYQLGCPGESRFINNGDGTVTDTCTGLMWQRNTADVNGDGQILDDGSDSALWCDALTYCENLSFAGHDDWRLPNVRELTSILDYGRYFPAIDPVFGSITTTPYCSSTSSANHPSLAWFVYFGGGLVYDDDGKGSRALVRAVRSSPRT